MWHGILISLVTFWFAIGILNWCRFCGWLHEQNPMKSYDFWSCLFSFIICVGTGLILPILDWHSENSMLSTTTLTLIPPTKSQIYRQKVANVLED